MSEQQNPYDVVLAKQNIDPVSLPEGAQVYPINEAIRELVRVEVRKALNEIITEIRMQQHEGLTILR